MDVLLQALLLTCEYFNNVLIQSINNIYTTTSNQNVTKKSATKVDIIVANTFMIIIIEREKKFCK